MATIKLADFIKSSSKPRNLHQNFIYNYFFDSIMTLIQDGHNRSNNLIIWVSRQGADITYVKTAVRVSLGEEFPAIASIATSGVFEELGN
ncbi:hypothetical protein AFK68_15140 [Hydrocoleum sp. CS-953]|nr:hypothetical protein AFK68_15140 [Hydrocoleum sp. CS-953]